jgi:hypothetical protein
MEFGMKQPNSFSGGSNVEWYSSGAGAHNPSSYQYAPPPAAAASAYNNSFEDEPPLLEGGSSDATVHCFDIPHAEQQQASATHARQHSRSTGGAALFPVLVPAVTVCWCMVCNVSRWYCCQVCTMHT